MRVSKFIHILPYTDSDIIIRPVAPLNTTASDHMTAGAFTEGTVGFLDILGFTSLVTSAERDKSQESA